MPELAQDEKTEKPIRRIDEKTWAATLSTINLLLTSNYEFLYHIFRRIPIQGVEPEECATAAVYLTKEGYKMKLNKTMFTEYLEKKDLPSLFGKLIHELRHVLDQDPKFFRKLIRNSVQHQLFNIGCDIAINSSICTGRTNSKLNVSDLWFPESAAKMLKRPIAPPELQTRAFYINWMQEALEELKKEIKEAKEKEKEKQEQEQEQEGEGEGEGEGSSNPKGGGKGKGKSQNKNQDQNENKSEDESEEEDEGENGSPNQSKPKKTKKPGNTPTEREPNLSDLLNEPDSSKPGKNKFKPESDKTDDSSNSSNFSTVQELLDLIKEMSDMCHHDDMIDDDLSEAEIRGHNESFAATIKAALEKDPNHNAGNLPFNLSESIQNFLDFAAPQINWKQGLKRFVDTSSTGRLKASFSRLNRWGGLPRMIISPQKTGLIWLDQSGSMEDEAVDACFNEMKGVFDADTTLDLITFDATPSPIILNWKPKAKKNGGKFRNKRGGTMFEPLYIALKTGKFGDQIYPKRSKYSFVILMTDGCPCDRWPEKKELGVPLIVVNTTELEIPAYIPQCHIDITKNRKR